VIRHWSKSYSQTPFISHLEASTAVRIIALGQVEEYARQTPGPDSTALNDLRFCKVVAFTNAGQGDLHFILKWINAKKDQIWLEITVSTI
jgi:hypothetical protein